MVSVPHYFHANVSSVVEDYSDSSGVVAVEHETTHDAVEAIIKDHRSMQVLVSISAASTNY